MTGNREEIDGRHSVVVEACDNIGTKGAAQASAAILQQGKSGLREGIRQEEIRGIDLQKSSDAPDQCQSQRRGEPRDLAGFDALVENLAKIRRTATVPLNEVLAHHETN